MAKEEATTEASGRRFTFEIEESLEGPGAAMFVVRCPELPGINTQGRTLASALRMAADALQTMRANVVAGSAQE